MLRIGTALRSSIAGGGPSRSAARSTVATHLITPAHWSSLPKGPSPPKGVVPFKWPSPPGWSSYPEISNAVLPFEHVWVERMPVFFLNASIYARCWYTRYRAITAVAADPGVIEKALEGCVVPPLIPCLLLPISPSAALREALFVPQTARLGRTSVMASCTKILRAGDNRPRHVLEGME